MKRLYPQIDIRYAMELNLLVRRENCWYTPYGGYKRLGNAVRFLLKYHGPIHRKHNFCVKIYHKMIDYKPFLRSINE